MQIDLTPQQCEQLLEENHYAHLGCVDNNEPHVLPITYAYLDGFIYGYAQEGEKIEIMRKHPTVCVQVEQVQSGYEWQSVSCWGKFQEVTDEKMFQEIKLLLAAEHGQVLVHEGKMPVSPMINSLHEHNGQPGIVYMIKPDRITGRGVKS